MTESKLVGYVRKSQTGTGIRVTIDIKAFNDCGAETTRDGREYISLIMNSDKVKEIMDGDREVTSLCFISEE